MTNDKKNPEIFLTIKGYVEKFASIIPQRVRLLGVVGQDLKTDVKIAPEQKYPFKILDVSTKNHSNITFKLNKVKDSKPTEYLLAIKNIKKDKGRYHDTIIIKTDSDIKPEFQIHVHGNIREEKSGYQQQGNNK